MENNNQNNQIKNMHTYASDMAEAVRMEQASIVKIAVAEQKKREEESSRITYKKESSKSTIYIIIGIVLIVLGFFAFKFINTKTKESQTHEVINATIPTLVTVDSQDITGTDAPAGREDLAKLIQSHTTGTGKADSIKAIFIGKDGNYLDAPGLFSAMGSSAPNSLVRTITEMTIGVYETNTKENSLFFLMKTNSYDQAFAGILMYEKVMLDDYFAIFGIDASTNPELYKKTFEDVLIDNNDARALKDNNGKILLIYSFISKDKFVITNNIETIKALTKRIRTQNIRSL